MQDYRNEVKEFFSGDEQLASEIEFVLKTAEKEREMLEQMNTCSLAGDMPPPRDPMLQLVSLQQASGCWLLDPALAAALGKTIEEVEKSKPAMVGFCKKLFGEGYSGLEYDYRGLIKLYNSVGNYEKVFEYHNVLSNWNRLRDRQFAVADALEDVNTSPQQTQECSSELQEHHHRKEAMFSRATYTTASVEYVHIHQHHRSADHSWK
ncbi:uncharacterized protein LOC115779914 [Archocentrus centrarchus]|uniref:uncharacterized protein LOC115779914 n=1 Tax=Archocentrus centrarchus TaxID=63155 RepID=UPI0011EA2392|nr:uncharacterized protein LOC115779914 [Archocentrus centrarchus]